MRDACFNTHSYVVHGLTLAIFGEEAVLAPLRRRLSHFSVAKSSVTPNLHFKFQAVSTFYPDDFGTHSSARNVMPMRSAEVLYCDSSHMLSIYVPDRAWAKCDINTGEVSVFYKESEATNIAVLSHPLFTIPLAELLKHRGLYMVHAAGVSIDSEGLLIAGASGAGKTTLTLALVRAGFDFLGDDTTFLRNDSDGLQALAFPDEVDVTADTVRLFPELQDLAREPLSNGRRKWSIAPPAIYQSRIIDRCVPRVLVFPQVADAEESVLTPMPKDAALLEMMCNVVRTEAGAAQAHLDTLALLVQRCSCFRLQTGRDFHALSGILRSVLNHCPD